MRDCTRDFIQKQGIFHHFKTFKTEIIHIYLLIFQTLKQLSPSVSVTSDGYLPPLRAKRRGKYLTLVTDTEGDNCFSICSVSE